MTAALPLLTRLPWGDVTTPPWVIPRLHGAYPMVRHQHDLGLASGIIWDRSQRFGITRLVNFTWGFSFGARWEAAETRLCNLRVA